MTRVLLDAYVSGRNVGRVLTEDGHTVLAIDSDPELEGLSDQAVLSMAIQEQRVMIIANVKDFLPLVTAMVAGGISHSGLLLLPNGARNEDFGRIIRGTREALADRSQKDWVDRMEWLR